jgi:hypothetical protein
MKQHITGFENVLNQMRLIELNCQILIAEALVDSGQEFHKTAMDNAPFRSGDLKDTSELLLEQDKATVRFVVPYAVYVERIDRHHTQGGARYLERALAIEAPKFEVKARDAMRRGCGL